MVRKGKGKAKPKPKPKGGRRARARALRAWGVLRWCLRTGGIACAVLLLLAIAVFVTLKTLVTPEKLRARMVRHLERTFNRPVDIEHVTLLLHQGIKVRRLEVSESKDFPGKVFLRSEFLLVKIRPWALLRGRIELAQVLLMSPEIRLTRRADGVWNLQDMLMRPDEPAAEAGKGKFDMPPLHAAEEISIERGVLRVRDVPNKLHLSFDDVDLRVSGFNPAAPFGVRVKFRNASRIGGKRVRADVRFKGAVSLGRFEAEGGMLAAEKLVMVVDGQRIEAEGTLRGFRRPKLSLKARLPRLTSEILSWYREVPDGIDIPATAWELRSRPVEVSTSASAPPAPGAVLGQHVIERLAVAGGGMRLSAGGRVDLDARRLRLKVRSSGLPLDKAAGLYGPWKENRVEGAAVGSVTLDGPFAKPALDRLALTLRGFSMSFWHDKRISKAHITVKASDRLRSFHLRATKGTYVAFGSALSDVDLDFGIERGDLAVSTLEATWNEARVKVRGCVKHVKKPTEVFFEATADTLRMDNLYTTIENIIAIKRKRKGLAPTGDDRWAHVFKYAIPPRFPDLTGRIRVSRAHSPNFDTQNLEILCDLKHISRGLDDVDGRFRMSFGPGRVSDIPDVQKAHPLNNVLLLPFVEMQKIEKKSRLSLDTAIPLTLDFTRTYGEFGVRGGVVDVRYMHFDSGQFLVYSDGRADFPHEGVDLHVLLRRPTSEGNLPYHLKDEKGRPSIDISLKGSLNSPEVQFHTRKMKADDIENALAEGLKRVQAFPPLEDRLGCGGK